MTARWRVVRLAPNGNGTDVCRHRFQRVAYWCARRNEKRTENGVFFDVREVDHG